MLEERIQGKWARTDDDWSMLVDPRGLIAKLVHS